MKLPRERVSPYVRALIGALDALAPNDEYVPLARAQHHLRAIDPALSGDVLAPHELAPETGLPAYPWMERARAESHLAARSADLPDDAAIQRATALDQELGQRMRARRDLHRHLQQGSLLPSLKLSGAVRRLQPREVTLVYDRLAPDGRWLRIRAELGAAERSDALHVDARGRLTVHETLQHLFTRHSSSPLMALWATLEQTTQGELQRLSRGQVGPFWFPGVPVARGIPADLYKGLVLHSSLEVFGRDVDGDRHLDPWVPSPPSERVPSGCGRHRERRFAATPTVIPAIHAWTQSQGMHCVVVPMGPRRRRL